MKNVTTAINAIKQKSDCRWYKNNRLTNSPSVLSSHQALDAAAKAVKGAFEEAQAKLSSARQSVIQKKEECKQKMSLKCDRCKDMKCKEATRNCKGALDKFGKWIGGVVNAAGKSDMYFKQQIFETIKFSPQG